MVKPGMRTSPLQPIVSRPAKAKHSLKSKLSTYSSNQAPVNIPGYVTSMYPGTDTATKRAMVASIERYLTTPAGQEYGMPTPAMCVHLFDGLLD